MNILYELYLHCFVTLFIQGENESNQLENNLKLDSIINLLNLVHEPNELNLT